MSPEYRVFETGQFAGDLENLVRSGRQKIVQKLRRVVYAQLRRSPHFGPNIRASLKATSPRHGAAGGGEGQQGSE